MREKNLMFIKNEGIFEDIFECVFQLINLLLVLYDGAKDARARRVN